MMQPFDTYVHLRSHVLWLAFTCIIPLSSVVAQSQKHLLNQEFERLRRADPKKGLAWVDSVATEEVFSESELDLLRADAYFSSTQFLPGRLYYARAKDAAIELGNDSLLSEAWVGLAQCSYRLSDLQSAVASAERAIEVADAVGNETNLAQALTLIGNVMLNQKDYESALDFFSRAINIHLERNDSSQLAANYNNLGNVHLGRKQYDEAERYFRMTIELDSMLGSKSYLAGDYNNLGLVMKNRGEFERAERIHLRSMEINEELGLISWIPGNLNNLGNVYDGLGQTDKAIDHFKRSMEMSDSLGIISTKNDARANLAEMYKKVGKYQEANELLEEIIQSQRKIYNEEVAKNLTSFNNYYELLQKESEIELLKQREELNAIKAQRQRLWYLAIILVVSLLGILIIWWLRMRSYRERHRLELDLQYHQLKALQLQMNPHFLFNTLGAIGNYIEEHNAEDAGRFLSKFSKLMRNFLESAETPSTTVEKEVALLTRYLELEQLRSEGAFMFEVKAEEGLFGNHIPSMVIQPLVENAVLHGVKKRGDQEGRIDVSFNREADSIICTVEDNGPGMPSNKSTDQSKSLGMSLIRRRLRLLSKRSGQNLRLELEQAHRKDGVKVMVYLGDGKFKSE